MQSNPIQRHSRFLALVAAASFGLSACTTIGTPGATHTTNDADRRYLAEIALKRWSDEAARLFLVSARVFDTAARTGQCEPSRSTTGFLLDSDQNLPSNLREEARLLGLQSGAPRIIAVAPGAPAAEAGLMPGDRVLATTAGQPEHSGQLTIRRDDTEFKVTLTGRLTCDYTVQLEPETEIGAYGYFNGIHVTYGQARAFPDDAMLAFVVGHELGHFVSGHPFIRLGILSGTAAVDVAVTKGLLTAASQLALRPTWRREELEADRIGLLLARQAGYDADRILEAWPTYAAAAPERVKRGWFADHPDMAERYAALSAILGAQAGKSQQAK